MTTSRDIARIYQYMTLEEVEALARLTALTPETGVIVNIGAGAGTSGLCFAEVRPSAKRYTIDICPGTHPYGLGGLENERNAFMDSGLALPTQILDDSFNVGKNWKDEKVDLLFIDGNHSELGVRLDVQAWTPHMNSHSILVFHDYGKDMWPGVKIAVDDLMKGFERLAHVSILIGFRYEQSL